MSTSYCASNIPDGCQPLPSDQEDTAPDEAGRILADAMASSAENRDAFPDLQLDDWQPVVNRIDPRHVDISVGGIKVSLTQDMDEFTGEAIAGDPRIWAETVAIAMKAYWSNVLQQF